MEDRVPWNAEGRAEDDLDADGPALTGDERLRGPEEEPEPHIWRSVN